jgi:hypothetical protein
LDLPQVVPVLLIDKTIAVVDDESMSFAKDSPLQKDIRNKRK